MWFCRWKGLRTLSRTDVRQVQSNAKSDGALAAQLTLITCTSCIRIIFAREVNIAFGDGNNGVRRLNCLNESSRGIKVVDVWAVLVASPEPERKSESVEDTRKIKKVRYIRSIIVGYEPFQIQSQPVVLLLWYRHLWVRQGVRWKS